MRTTMLHGALTFMFLLTLPGASSFAQTDVGIATAEQALKNLPGRYSQLRVRGKVERMRSGDTVMIPAEYQQFRVEIHVLPPDVPTNETSNTGVRPVDGPGVQVGHDAIELFRGAPLRIWRSSGLVYYRTGRYGVAIWPRGGEIPLLELLGSIVDDLNAVPDKTSAPTSKPGL